MHHCICATVEKPILVQAKVSFVHLVRNLHYCVPWVSSIWACFEARSMCDSGAGKVSVGEKGAESKLCDSTY